MLSKAQMVKVRKALEIMYDGKCSIIERRKVKKLNGATGFEDIVVVENEPCRLSFETVKNTNQEDNTASSTSQITKLFIAPELEIKPGSKIEVTQNKRTTEYKASSAPAIYCSHQEIVLELFESWA